MINPATHAIAEFPIPTASAGPHGITAGPDGNLWFTEINADQIGMINPTTHAVTEFPIPTAGAEPDGITAGPDGNLWFTEFNGRPDRDDQPDDPRHHRVPHPHRQCLAHGITAGPDGNLWFTEISGRQVGMINPATHAITEFPIPTASPDLSGSRRAPTATSGSPRGFVKIGMMQSGDPRRHRVRRSRCRP